MASQHDVLPRNKGHAKLFVGIEYPYRFYGIAEHRAICKRDRDRIPKVYILEYLKMVAVTVPVNNADAFFTGISGGLKPARRLIKRFIVNADRYGDVGPEDRQSESLAVNMFR